MLCRFNNIVSASYKIIVGWAAFANCLADSICSLQELDLCNNRVMDEGLAALAEYFAGSNNIKELSLCDNALITSSGWSTFFHRLHNSNAKFEKLSIRNNTLGDAGVASMVHCLSGMNGLKYLYLDSDVVRPGTDGARSFANLLCSPSSILEHVEFSLDAMCDDTVELFADALEANEHIYSLIIHTGRSSQVTARGLNALAGVFCNTENIESVYLSNHTLQYTNFVGTHSILTPCLKLNENNNKFEVARQKLLQHYFTEGNKNIQDIFELEKKVWPYVMAWAGRDDTGSSLLYNIIRDEPSLFCSKGKTSTAVLKRKRGS